MSHSLRNRTESARKVGPRSCANSGSALTTNRIRGAIMADPIPNEIPPDVKARFWAKVDVRGPDECWPWTAGRNVHGYGVFSGHRERPGPMVASRYSLQLQLGRRLTAKEMACHRCDNRLCVNPAHLFLGNAKANMADAAIKGRTHKWAGSRRGEGNPRAKLTEVAVKEIKARILSGAGTTELANEYGVALTTICEIKSGKNWAHV